MKELESFFMPNSFNDVMIYLDKSTILLCMYLYKYFTTIDYNPLGSKTSTIGNLAKELKFSRNTVIKALEQINDNKVFIVKTNNGYPKTVSIFLPSSLCDDNLV